MLCMWYNNPSPHCKQFAMVHFPSIINQQIIFLFLHPATPLVHPSPTPSSKLTLLDT